MYSCLMGAIDFSYTFRDEIDYYITSEANIYDGAFDDPFYVPS